MFAKRRDCWAEILAVAMGSVCSLSSSLTVAAGPLLRPSPLDRGLFNRYVDEGRDSPFGLDYVFVEDPSARDQRLVDYYCGQVGIRWVNLSQVTWDRIERTPPRNGTHRYDWSRCDGAVKAWQKNGVHIMMSLRVINSWATARPSGKEFVYLTGPFLGKFAKGACDYLPKKEHELDFRSFIFNLVERYDGDGVADMPGLLFPVRHYQIGNECYNEVFWGGTADEYGLLLQAAAEAARSADRNVRILLSGIGFEEVYGYYDEEMDPRARAYVERYLPKVSTPMRKFVARGFQFSRKMASFCDWYDILDARWPYYGIVKKSQDLLRQSGCSDKEVWSAELYSQFPLMEPTTIPNWTLHAYPTPSRSEEYATILKNPGHPQFRQINAWYRGLQAAQVVKMCMAGLHAGTRKLMMGWAFDVQASFSVSSFAYQGLYSATFKKLWPAAYTYNLLIDKLDGLVSVKRLSMPEYIYVYECAVRDGKKLLVAFCDDHIGQNHNEPTGTAQAVIPLQANRAVLTHIITDIDQTTPRVERTSVKEGKVQVSLTEYPVFIETETQ